MATRVRVVLVVIALTIANTMLHPFGRETTANDRFNARMAACDQLPTVEIRWHCWRKVFHEDAEGK